MKKAFCLFLLFFVCRSARLLYAGTYTVDNLPMVYLQDKTKHVVNPDGILSAQRAAEATGAPCRNPRCITVAEEELVPLYVPDAHGVPRCVYCEHKMP